MHMPKTVPFLKSKDFCKGVLDGVDGTHCLIGWIEEVFKDTESRIFVENLMKKQLKVPHVSQIIEFNDNPKRRKSILARFWNRIMAKLGYTEGNPVKLGEKNATT